MKRFPLFIGVLCICSGLLCCKTQSFQNKSDDEQWARLYLKGSLNDTLTKAIVKDTLIQNSETAIQIAEPILFKRFGKNHIHKQKPYRVNHLNGYWMLRGTHHKDAIGGTFMMIIRAIDGKIIEVSMQ